MIWATLKSRVSLEVHLSRRLAARALCAGAAAADVGRPRRGNNGIPGRQYAGYDDASPILHTARCALGDVLVERSLCQTAANDNAVGRVGR